MVTLLDKLNQAYRLERISQRVGFALWQVQILEGVAAEYFVLLAQAKRGMGATAGNALIDAVKRKTFGMTIRSIEEAGLLEQSLSGRIRALLDERNWLVHSSRNDSTGAVYSDPAMTMLVRRVDAIADESLVLVKIIGEIAERFVMSHGITSQQINDGAATLLAEWRAADSD